MYYYNEDKNGWTIDSNNKLDYYFSLFELFIFELLPFFVKGFFKYGAREFFITKHEEKK